MRLVLTLIIFPPFSFELALILFSPLLLVLLLVVVILLIRKKHRSAPFRTPKPVNRFVK